MNLNGPGKPAYPPAPVSIALQPSRTGPPPPPLPHAPYAHTQPGRQNQKPPAVGHQGPYPTLFIPQVPKTIGLFRPSIARPPTAKSVVPVQVHHPPAPNPPPARLPLEQRDFLSVGRQSQIPSQPSYPTQPPAPAPAPAPPLGILPVIVQRPPPDQGRGPTLAPAPIPPPAPPAPPPPPPDPTPRGRGRPRRSPPPSGLINAPALQHPPKRPAPDQPAHPPPPPTKRTRPDGSVIDLTKLPDLPPYLTVPPDISKPVMASNDTHVPTEFSWSMKTLTLSRIDQVDLWVTQVEEMAKACGCYREMTTRFGAFPKPGTVEAFICQTRYAACWRILTETISGPVWAYMRALGYSKIPLFRGNDGIQWQPAPIDAFYFAKQAGYRLANPGSPHQPREEIMRMVEELRIGKPSDYPSQSQFSKGHNWMKEILDNMIRKGDRQVCNSLYDSPPSFAPNLPGPPRPEEYAWNLPGTPLSGGSQKRHRSVEVHLAQQRQQMLATREQQWARIDDAQRNGQYSVIPSTTPAPPTPPPPARSVIPQPRQYQPPYVQQPPPPPPPHGPGGPQPYPPQQMGPPQHPMPARPGPPVAPPNQGQPPQGFPQGGPPPQQGPPPPLPPGQARQIPQPQPSAQGQPPPQTEVITIQDSPAPTPEDLPTPPPLFTEEEDNADDDNDGDGDGDGEAGQDGGGGGSGGNDQQQTGAEEADEDDEEEEEEETFHDAEEGNNNEGQDDDVIMADGDGDGDGQATEGANSNTSSSLSTPGTGDGEEEEEEEEDSGDGEEEESEEE